MTRNPRIEHVKAKAHTRGDVREVGFRYLARLQPVVRHMHEVLRLHASDDESIHTAISQYVIALACQLETYFRDIFRFSIEYDSSYFDRSIQAYRPRLPSDQELAKEGVTRYDFVAESLTLQSAASISDALDLYFHSGGFRSAIESSRIIYAVPSRGARASNFPLSAFPDWWEDLKQIFDLRHELAHDANSTPDIDRGKVARLEALAVFLPQYVTMMVVFYSQLPTSNEAGSVPAILLVEDLLARDWEIIE